MITVDMSGALKKTQVLLQLGRASKKQATLWSSATVKKLMRSAKNMKSSGRGTGFMSNNIGQSISDDGRKILIGTGVHGTKNVIYANIQDTGGLIKAKKAKYLTIPFPGIKGVARNFSNTFFLKSKAGNLILAQALGGKIKPLFLLRKSVMIPRSGWFTDVVERALPELSTMMTEEAILKKAEGMAGGK